MLSPGGPVTFIRRMLSIEPSLIDLNYRQRGKITTLRGGHGRFGPGRGSWGSRAIGEKGGWPGVTE
jgi:hypothetical protein